MSYHHSALQRYGARRSYEALGYSWTDGVVDFVTGAISPVAKTLLTQEVVRQNEACLAARSAQPQIIEIDARIDRIHKEWKPSGFFSLDDIMRIVIEVNAEAQKAYSNLFSAPRTTREADTTIKQWTGKMVERIKESAQFMSTVASARAAGATVIEAQGLKRWVVNTLMDVSSAMGVTFVMYCNLTILDDVKRWLDRLWRILVAIKDAIVDAIVRAGWIIYRIPDTIGTMITVLKWGTVAGLGIWAFSVIKKRREGR